MGYFRGSETILFVALEIDPIQTDPFFLTSLLIQPTKAGLQFSYSYSFTHGGNVQWLFLPPPPPLFYRDNMDAETET